MFYKLFLLLIVTFAINPALAQNNQVFDETNLKVIQDTKDTPKPENKIKDVTKKNEEEKTKFTKKLFSLMFGNDEIDNIGKAIDSLNNAQVFIPDDDKEKAAQAAQASKIAAEEKNAKSYIYLASIIYLSPEDWAVWIGDQKITKQTNKKSNEFYLKLVTRDQVEVLWTIGISKWKILSGIKSDEAVPKVNDKNQIEINFTIRPNQTFILGSNAVVEGRKVVNSDTTAAKTDVKK